LKQRGRGQNKAVKQSVMLGITVIFDGDVVQRDRYNYLHILLVAEHLSGRSETEGRINPGSGRHLLEGHPFIRGMGSFQGTGTEDQRFYPGRKKKVAIGMRTEGIHLQRQVKPRIDLL